MCYAGAMSGSDGLLDVSVVGAAHNEREKATLVGKGGFGSSVVKETRGVEDDIVALVVSGWEDVPMVDHVIRAEFANEVVVCARGPGHFCTKILGDLHRKATHAP